MIGTDMSNGMKTNNTTETDVLEIDGLDNMERTFLKMFSSWSHPPLICAVNALADIKAKIEKIQNGSSCSQSEETNMENNYEDN